MDRVAKDFVRMLKEKTKQSCDLQQNDFMEELKKYFLEVTGVFALGVRLGAIKAGEHLTQSSMILNLIYWSNYWSKIIFVQTYHLNVRHQG